MKTIGYTIKITIDEYHQWHNEILMNRSITPEVTGILLGRAQPLILKDKDEKKS